MKIKCLTRKFSNITLPRNSGQPNKLGVLKMFNWLKMLLRKPLDLPETSNLIVPIRYVNTGVYQFYKHLNGYNRVCMNLETGEISNQHFSGMEITNELCELDIQLAYDKLPDEYKPKYRAYLEKTNVKIQY